MNRGKEENMEGKEGMKGGWALRNWFCFKKKKGKSRGSTYLLYTQYFFIVT